MARVARKQGALEPPIEARLLDAQGEPIPLGFSDAVFWKCALPTPVEKAASIVSPSTADVRYDLEAGDTDVEGEFDMEWVIVRASGRRQPVPGDYFDTLVIIADP